MKRILKIFSVASAFALLVGGAICLAKQDRKQALQTKAAVDTSTYTMTAREIVGALGRYNNCDGAVTGDNVLRLTSQADGQFHFFFATADSYNFKQLSKDCTSMTVTLKVSSASDLEARLFCRYWIGEAPDNYLWTDLNLSEAAADFVEVTFAKPADGDFFDAFIFTSKQAGAYVELQSLRFDGLTSFNLLNFAGFPGGWNYFDRQNGTHSTLFKYDGDFALQSGGADYSAQVGEKITLNGKPFSQAGTIDHVHGNRFLQFTYVDSVMSDLPDGFTEPVIEIHEIVPFEGAFLTPQRIVFNGTAWESKNLISDEELIKNNDFVLFSPADYGCGGPNADWGFYTKDGQPMAELTGHQNFGIQFTIRTIDDGAGNFQLKFGNAITTHNFLLITYYNQRIYLEQFNGASDGDLTNATLNDINLGDQHEHLIELYVIKDSASTVQILLGVDGFKIFRTRSLDITSAGEWNYTSLFCVDRNGVEKVAIGSSPATTTDALNRFYARALANPAGNNWMEKYASAKAYYDTFLSPGERTALAESGAYAGIRDAYDRLRFEAVTEYAAPKKTELENYIADLSVYGADEQEEIADIIAAGKAAIDGADSYEEVDEILAEYKALLDDVPTYAELLAQAKEDAIAELEAYADPADYREEQQQTLAQRVSDGTYRINQATTLEKVAEELATYKGLIDEIPTDAQLLAQYKAEKKAYLDTMAAQILPNYREAEQQMINGGVAQGKQAIDAATSEAQIDAIIANLQTQLGQLKTDDQYCHEEAEAWDASVDAIGEVTLAKETQIRQVQNAYDELSATAKSYTTKMPELDQKVNRLNYLLREKTKAENVETLISAIPDLTRSNYDEDAHLVAEARAAYDVLSDDAKGMVGNYSLLQGAEGRLAQLDAAIAVDQQILNIGTVTLDKEQQIINARAAYDALSANENRWVLYLSTLEAAEARLAELKQEKANAEYVDELINQIGQIDASSECAAKITNARAAYEALNEEEKSMVTGLTTLQAVEAEFAAALAQAKDAGKANVDEAHDALNLNKYSSSNKELIEQLTADAKSAMDAAHSSDEIAEILSDYQTALANIPQKKAAAKKGCGGSIIATSVVLSTLALSGLCLLSIKKRKED